MTIYTFKIDVNNSGNVFYNLLVTTDNNNLITSTNILEYRPSEIWLEDKSDPFDGNVVIHENDLFSSLEIGNLINEKSLNQCAIGVTGYWNCNFNNEHAPGEGTDCTSWEYIISIVWGPCTPTIINEPVDGGFPVNPIGGSGGGAGGSGGSIGSPTIECTPTIDNPCVETITIPLPPSNADLLRINELTQIIENSFNYIESEESLIERIEAIGEYFELTSHQDFSGLSEMLQVAINDPSLTLEDYVFMWQKSKEAYDIIKPYAFQLSNLDSLEDINTIIPLQQLSIAENNLTTVAFLPQVKSLIGDYWPQNQDEWLALGEILFQPSFLLEIGVGFIPGSSIIDVVTGLNEGDYVAISIGVAGLVVDAFGGTIIKAIGKIGKVAYKGFKVFKIAFKYLQEVKNSIQYGLKTVLDNNIVKIVNNLDNEIARIYNVGSSHSLSTLLKFNYSGFGGNIITTPNKTTTLIGKWDNQLENIWNSGLAKQGENVGVLMF